jgi:hypothetical protein
MQHAGYGSEDRLKEAMARCEAQLERTEAGLRRLESRLLGVDLDREDFDGLEDLWAVDVDVPLDAYLDRRALTVDGEASAARPRVHDQEGARFRPASPDCEGSKLQKEAPHETATPSDGEPIRSSVGAVDAD